MTNANYYAGRIAAILGTVLAIAGGLLPIIADTDWTSTAGILAGVIAAESVILKFIHGAQRHEDRLNLRS